MNWTDFKAYAARGTWKNTLRKNGLWLAGRAALYFFLIVLGFVFLYPFLFMISRSLMSYNDIVDATVKWFPKVLSPGNYALAFQTLEVPLTGLNSLIVTLLCTLGHVVACAFIGYGLGRYSYGFTKWIFAFVVLSIIIPAQNLIIPRYIIYSSMEQLLNVKILDTYLPLIVPAFFGFGLNGGLFIFLFRQYYLRFPKSIEEAAHIDGAGPVVTFFRIALPTAGSTILVCLVLSIVWHWNDYYEPSIFLTAPKKWLLPQVLPDMFARLTASSMGDLTASAEATKYHAGVVMAGTVISVLPLLILYFLLQRWFMEGVERSGLVE